MRDHRIWWSRAGRVWRGLKAGAPSFQARVIVHPAGSLDIRSLSKKAVALVPDQRAASLLERVPEGAFLT